MFSDSVTFNILAKSKRNRNFFAFYSLLSDVRNIAVGIFTLFWIYGNNALQFSFLLFIQDTVFAKTMPSSIAQVEISPTTLSKSSLRRAILPRWKKISFVQSTLREPHDSNSYRNQWIERSGTRRRGSQCRLSFPKQCRFAAGVASTYPGMQRNEKVLMLLGRMNN